MLGKPHHVTGANDPYYLEIEDEAFMSYIETFYIQLDEANAKKENDIGC